MIPFVYTVSLFIDRKGVAKCICIGYEVCPAIAILYYKSEQIDTKFYDQMFPCTKFLLSTLKEVGDLDIFGYTETAMDILNFLSHGLAFTVLLYFCESYKSKRFLGNLCRKVYLEKTTVPDDPDVSEEKKLIIEGTSEFALKIQNLTKYYGRHCALKNVTYGVRANECFGLVGASGAGKTSTLDIVTGLRLPDDGSAFIGKQFVNRIQKIGYCPQFDSMLARLSCKQNMVILAGLMGYKCPDLIAEEMLCFLDLTKHGKKAFGYCSGGQKRRVNIGAALLNPSELVILDEPTAGLDPQARRHVWTLLKAMRASGKALLLSSHSMEECEALCSRIGVLVQGRLVALGSSQALKTRYANNLFLHVILKTPKDRELVANAVQSMFPTSRLITKRTDALEVKFKIPRAQREKVSDFYKKVQKMASELPLHDYFLLQSTLDDVLETLNELHREKPYESRGVFC